MKLSRRQSRFAVAIYLADAPQQTAHAERLGIFLTRLFTGSVVADDARAAAAKAWSNHVGEYRRDRLRSLRAPEPIADQQIDTSLIVKQLAASSICPNGGFQLDNGCETWFVSVNLLS